MNKTVILAGGLAIVLAAAGIAVNSLTLSSVPEGDIGQAPGLLIPSPSATPSETPTPKPTPTSSPSDDGGDDHGGGDNSGHGGGDDSGGDDHGSGGHGSDD